VAQIGKINEALGHINKKTKDVDMGV